MPYGIGIRRTAALDASDSDLREAALRYHVSISQKCSGEYLATREGIVIARDRDPNALILQLERIEKGE